MDYGRAVAYSVTGTKKYADEANVAAWRAFEAFDGTGTMQGFVALCVKRHIWCLWRKAAKAPITQLTFSWWEQNICDVEPQCDEQTVPQEDIQLLSEYYIDKWPLDVVARRHSVTVYRIRKMIRAAVDRLSELLDGEEATAAKARPSKATLKAMKRLSFAKDLKGLPKPIARL